MASIKQVIFGCPIPIELTTIALGKPAICPHQLCPLKLCAGDSTGYCPICVYCMLEDSLNISVRVMLHLNLAELMNGPSAAHEIRQPTQADT
eukprot:2818083-Pleurochrysis_carterae.AAC.2